jgi:curved DNA-binding protein
MSQDDYYRMLGLEPRAETGEIKEAYRRLAFEHHPDRNRGNPTAAERMKGLNEAYAVLSNPEKRRRYDDLRRQFGSAAHGRFRTSHSEQDIFSGSDINAVFEEMARAAGFRGADDIFREFYGQTYQSFRFRRPGVRVRAFGFGRPAANARTGGRVSWGAGLLERIARRALGRLVGGAPPEKGADLRDRIRLDPKFAAAGGPYAYFHRQRSKKLVVKVPANVREGQHIRLAGMGAQGRAGGRSGDLLLEVRFRRPVWGRLQRWAKRVLKPQ